MQKEIEEFKRIMQENTSLRIEIFSKKMDTKDLKVAHRVLELLTEEN